MKDLVTKSIYLVLASCCLALGLLGLVVPILPGVIFLVIAIFLLGKVSRRVQHWLDRQSWVKKLEWHVKKARLLTLADNARLGAWMALKSCLQVLSRLGKATGRLFVST